MSALDNARSVLRDSGPRADVLLPSPTLTRMWWDLRTIIAGLVELIDTPGQVEALIGSWQQERATRNDMAGGMGTDGNRRYQEGYADALGGCVQALQAVAGVAVQADPAGQVEAVMDVLAPWADGVPGVCERVRYPLFRFDHEGTMVMPSDGQVRMIAEQVVTRLRTAGGTP